MAIKKPIDTSMGGNTGNLSTEQQALYWLDNKPATSNIDTTTGIATGKNTQAIKDIGGTGNVLPDTISKDSNLYKRLQNTGLNDQQIADMYTKEKWALVKQPKETKQQSTVQTITADNGKVYNVTVNPDWTSSFTSQSGTGETRNFGTFDEAKKTILDNNKKVAPTQSIQQQAEPVVDRYQDNDPIRLTEIKTNLDAAAWATPELFYDRAAFNKAFEYDKRSDLQKSVLDNYFNQKQDVSVADYRAGKDNKSIVSSYLDGTLKDIDLTDLYKQDPTRYALVKEQIRKQKTINDANSEVSGTVEGIMKQFGITPQETIDLESEISKYDESTKAPEMLKLTQEMKDMTDKANEVNLQIENMEDTLKKELEWTGVTQDVFDSILADRTKALKNTYDSYVNKYDSASNMLAQIKDSADKRQTYIDKIKTQKQNEISSKLASLGFAYGIAKDTLWTDTTDKNIWKTIDTGTSKKPNVLMWNTKTQQYDIPVWGASIWGGASLGSTWEDGITKENAWLYSNDNDTIIKTILASGKFTKDQAKLLVDWIKRWGDVRAITLNQAKNIMWSTIATSLGNSELALEQMNQIQKLMDEYYGNWGNTDVFKWSFEEALTKIWETSNPKMVGIAARIAKALQTYRKAVSGTAYSVKEWAEIASIFPWIDKSQWLNKILLEAQKASLQSDIDTAYRATLLWAYDILNKKETQTPKKDTPTGLTHAQKKAQEWLASYKQKLWIKYTPQQVQAQNTAMSKIWVWQSVIGWF